MKRLTSASSTVTILKENRKGSLILKIDARLEAATAEDRQCNSVVWLWLLCEQDLQTVRNHVAQNLPLGGCSFLGTTQQSSVQRDRGAYGYIVASAIYIKMYVGPSRWSAPKRQVVSGQATGATDHSPSFLTNCTRKLLVDIPISAVTDRSVMYPLWWTVNRPHGRRAGIQGREASVTQAA